MSKAIDFYAMQKAWAASIEKSLLTSQESWQPMPLTQNHVE